MGSSCDGRFGRTTRTSWTQGGPARYFWPVLGAVRGFRVDVSTPRVRALFGRFGPKKEVVLQRIYVVNIPSAQGIALGFLSLAVWKQRTNKRSIRNTFCRSLHAHIFNEFLRAQCQSAFPEPARCQSGSRDSDWTSVRHHLQFTSSRSRISKILPLEAVNSECCSSRWGFL